MKTLLKIIGFSSLGIGMIFVIIILSPIIIYYLWNWLMPELFGVREITFWWEAFGISILSNILFKGTHACSK